MGNRTTDLLGSILRFTDDHSVLINLEGLGRRLDQFVHPTRKYLIDSVLRTYLNYVEVEEGCAG